MNTKGTVGSLIVLQGLFVLCALSILWYQYMGWFDVGFGLLSYRRPNIHLSVGLIGYFMVGLFHRRWLLIGPLLFALFHTVEEAAIGRWIKVVLNGLSLVVLCLYAGTKRTLHFQGAGRL